MTSIADLERAPHGAFLYCPVCQERASATPGDYFWMADDDVFECSHGAGVEDPLSEYGLPEPMLLVTEHVEIRPVQ